MWDQFMPYTDDSLLTTPRKSKKGLKSQLFIHSPYKPIQDRGTGGEGLSSADFPDSLHGFRQATSPLPRPKNESRNPAFKSKGQVSKGERPRLGGPGQIQRK